MPKDIAKEVVKNMVNIFESEESKPNVFTEIIQLSLEKDELNFTYTTEEKKLDELADWIKLNARKIHLLEKVRRALVFAGIPADIIRAELLSVYKLYTAKPEFRI